MKFIPDRPKRVVFLALKLAGLLGIHGLFVVFVSKKIVLLPYMIVWQILYISDIIECKDNTILSITLGVDLK